MQFCSNFKVSSIKHNRINYERLKGTSLAQLLWLWTLFHQKMTGTIKAWSWKGWGIKSAYDDWKYLICLSTLYCNNLNCNSMQADWVLGWLGWILRRIKSALFCLRSLDSFSGTTIRVVNKSGTASKALLILMSTICNQTKLKRL